jgi:hypothetical protein
MDQTSLCSDMLTSITIKGKGEKSVIICSTGSKKAALHCKACNDCRRKKVSTQFCVSDFADCFVNPTLLVCTFCRHSVDTERNLTEMNVDLAVIPEGLSVLQSLDVVS